mgnify:CR=1 FL=1
MALPQELLAPIGVDLRADDNKFEIVKGIEHVNYIDGKLDAGDVEEGDWVVKTATGFAVVGEDSAKAFPVVTGNNRYDALATGGVTVIVGGGWIYQTKKYATGSYTVGQALTIKGASKVPAAAASGDVVCGRVYSIDAAKGIMQILVVNV